VLYSFGILQKKGIPVLMYHKFDELKTDMLTVTKTQFEEHLKYLQVNDYQTITAQNLIDFYEKNTPIPAKPILLTFDDGYLNNLNLAYPILQKFHAKATIFLPTSYIGDTNKWDAGDEVLMSLSQLKSLDPALIEFGLHSHKHQNFKHLNLAEMEKDLLACQQFFKENNLPFVQALAYPYGGRPKDKFVLKSMKNLFQESGIRAAFRIGNKVNSLKIKDIYEINRIDIRGTDSFFQFKMKLKGRLKLF
jgi:peptidoglycan/xylan/chitin deacetylase (PgdA/CDA1 family)